MREIDVQAITKQIKKMFLNANYVISPDIYEAINQNIKSEKSAVGKLVLKQLIDNYDIAKSEAVAICQDTGMSIIFLKIGQDIHFINGSLNEALNKGVEEAYQEGYLRKSIVDDPVFGRKNTSTNTPAIIYSEIVSGDKLEITICAKGFGSENMSAIKMLTPNDGVEGVKQFVYETIDKAGPNPCPPMIIGIGIGGTFEKAALLAKHATTLDLNHFNENELYAALEKELLININKLGIGPAGLGGTTSCLKVNIEYFPTHIAGLPVAINICCHASRHEHFVY